MKRQMVRAIGMLSLVAMGGCASLHQTPMTAAMDHTASNKIYIVPTPTPLLAGPDTVRTSSPDGSTVFLCDDGTARDATSVSPGEPVCM